MGKNDALSSSDRIKNLRQVLGYSQRELAREFRVSASAVAHWESGERALSGPVEKLLELYESKASLKLPSISTRAGGR